MPKGCEHSQREWGVVSAWVRRRQTDERSEVEKRDGYKNLTCFYKAHLLSLLQGKLTSFLCLLWHDLYSKAFIFCLDSQNLLVFRTRYSNQSNLWTEVSENSRTSFILDFFWFISEHSTGGFGGLMLSLTQVQLSARRWPF